MKHSRVSVSYRTGRADRACGDTARQHVHLCVYRKVVAKRAHQHRHMLIQPATNALHELLGGVLPLLRELDIDDALEGEGGAVQRYFAPARAWRGE